LETQTPPEQLPLGGVTQQSPSLVQGLPGSAQQLLKPSAVKHDWFGLQQSASTVQVP
jgi:hypothetical protein